MHEITLRKCFSAAHNLREYRGKCERLHGHNYRVDIVLCSARLNATGMVMDFQEVKRLAALVMDKLDHAYLNEVAPFDDLNPTAENVACHIADEMAASRAGSRKTVVRPASLSPGGVAKESQDER